MQGAMLIRAALRAQDYDLLCKTGKIVSRALALLLHSASVRLSALSHVSVFKSKHVDSSLQPTTSACTGGRVTMHSLLCGRRGVGRASSGSKSWQP